MPAHFHFKLRSWLGFITLQISETRPQTIVPEDSDARISEESRISSSPRKSEADSQSPYRAFYR